MATRLLPCLALLGLFAARSAGLATHVGHDSSSAHGSRADVARDDSDDSLEKTLTRAERASWVAWQAHDGNFFENFLSDDHVEVGTNGVATKAQVVALVSSGACAVKSYSVDHFRATRFDQNTALLTYRAEQRTTCGVVAVPSPTWVSSLFVRRNGKWVNALYQHTQEQR
ncbi:MAG TPA: nuclear transport factor 2 family protein [Gemmatimonadaceae bacterium]